MNMLDDNLKNENPNVELGKALIKACLADENMDWLRKMTDQPDVDGALYGLYLGHLEARLIEWNGVSFIITPMALKELMKASCALGFYQQRSLEENKNIWEIGE